MTDRPEPFKRRFSWEQYEQVEHAYRSRTAGAVARMAKAGELGPEPFPEDLSEDTIRWMARQVKRRREGLETSQLARRPNRDALEVLRQRLVSHVDWELGKVERARKKGRSTDLRHLRQLISIAKELAAFPATGDDQAPKTRASPRPTGGGALLRALRASDAPSENADGPDSAGPSDAA